MTNPAMIELAPGLVLYPDFLPHEKQREMLPVLRDILRSAPLFSPRMPKNGQEFSVKMSNCGALGWVSDVSGYRYQPFHPDMRQPWPPIPVEILQVWQQVSGVLGLPEACLINFYDASARMGLHQDRDEQELSAPVVSISLGDSCRFRYGGLKRNDPTKSIRLNSGDILVIGGASRLAFHGVDRIYPQSSALLSQGGRINLTMRRVTPFEAK